MCRDNRTTEQIKGALAAEARLASQIGSNPMATPQDRVLRDELHKQMDKELTELDKRQS